MKYILFIKESCSYCQMASQLLEEKGVNYKTVIFEEEQESVLTEIKDVYGWKTVPMVFYKNGNLTKFIGGYTDLVELLKDE